MPDFEKIIKDFAGNANFAGTEQVNENADDLKRASFTNALLVREKECKLRFTTALIIMIIALLILVYFSIFQPNGIKTFKELMSVVGGGSIITMMYYILSIRDELTKIKQTTIIASVVDMATLNTMLLTLASK